MGIIQRLFERMRGQEEPDGELTEEVKDRYLTHLRRERNFQNNQEEKEYLKARIAAYKKKQIREGMFGIQEKRIRHQSVLDQKSILEQPNIMRDSCSIMGKKQGRKYKKRL